MKIILISLLAYHCLADHTGAPTVGPASKTTLFAGKDVNGTILALIQSEVNFTVNYQQKNSSTNKTADAVVFFSPPADANTTAEKKDSQIIVTIAWNQTESTENGTAGLWVLVFKKTKNGEKYLHNATLNFRVNADFGFPENASDYNQSVQAIWLMNTEITTDAKKDEDYWKCESSLDKSYDIAKTTLKAAVTLKSTEIEVFENITSEEFTGKNAAICAADNPTPAPAEGNWNVTSDGVTCIMIKSGIVLKLWYTNRSNETVGPIFVDVPLNATVNSSSTCGTNVTDQVITLDFYENWNLTIKFSDKSLYTSKTNGDYWLGYQIVLFAHYDEFPHKFVNPMSKTSHTYMNEVNETSGSGALTWLGATRAHSIVCTAGFNETVDGSRDKFQIDMDRPQVQAYSNSTTFAAAEHCPADDSSNDLIPIIVGACLAALVVVVLVAYLIGRARAKKTGYQSV